MIDFHCPDCNAAIRAPEQLAGCSGKCRSCGSKIVIPDVKADDDLDWDRVAAAAASTPPPAGDDADDDADAIAPTADTITAMPPRRTHVAPPSPRSAGTRPTGPGAIPKEPWYYGFLHSYGMLLFVGGILLSVVILVGGIVGAIRGTERLPGGFGPDPAFILATSFTSASVVVLVSMFLSAPILLLVDVARNIRATRYRN